jgi:hypothetical protein
MNKDRLKLVVDEGVAIDPEYKRQFEMAQSRGDAKLAAKLALLWARDIVSLDNKIARILNRIETYRTLAAHCNDPVARDTFLDCADTLTRVIKLRLAGIDEPVPDCSASEVVK